MSRQSSLRADDAQRHDGALLRHTPHPLRGNGRAYVGRALGQGAPSWLVQGLRVLAFLATGLILGLLALALVS